MHRLLQVESPTRGRGGVAVERMNASTEVLAKHGVRRGCECITPLVRGQEHDSVKNLGLRDAGGVKVIGKLPGYPPHDVATRRRLQQFRQNVRVQNDHLAGFGGWRIGPRSGS